MTLSENYILDGQLVAELQTSISDLFYVDRLETPRPAPQGTVIFIGHLLMQDSEAAYDIIAERWRRLEYTPLLRHHQNQVALEARPGIIVPTPPNPWINFGLAVATIASVWLTGSVYECQCMPVTPAHWLAGLPMMLAMMAILAAHEFGHYFAAKFHRVHVTLPYFIPLPVISPVGTLGAFIQLRSPFKTKRQLFDIGIAGPIAGLVFAIPLIFWGVANSNVHELTREPAGASVLEGNSIFYLGVKYLIHGQLLPSFDAYANLPAAQEFLLLLAGSIPAGGGSDILISSVAFAAWFGLFVTAMNLLPVGQLDGGHVVYSLIGDKARLLGMVLVGIMVAAGIFWWTGWLVWAFLTFFIIGVNHPPPLNDLVPLDTGRKIIAWVMIAFFVILFMPNPLQPL
ncbi:MAG: site-2 protease family protein [Anaerolineae bacterium]